VAWWHTHGGNDLRYDNENLSQPDKRFSEGYGIDGYLITPEDQFKHYISGSDIINEEIYMEYVKHLIIAAICVLSVSVSLSGSQSMRLEVVGSQKPYISEAMTNKLISVALAGMRESKHWSHFVPSQKVLVMYCCKKDCCGITNAIWYVEFLRKNRPEGMIGGGVCVKLDAKSFKVLSVLGTK
jgi:hypothetical protein